MTNSNRPAGLIQRDRKLLQKRHDARRTVKTYEQWLRWFLRVHGMRHPREMGGAGVNTFLSHRAVEWVVLTPEEVRAVLDRFDGVVALVAALLPQPRQQLHQIAGPRAGIQLGANQAVPGGFHRIQ
jgi:hypothetical protein